MIDTFSVGILHKFLFSADLEFGFDKFSSVVSQAVSFFDAGFEVEKVSRVFCDELLLLLLEGCHFVFELVFQVLSNCNFLDTVVQQVELLFNHMLLGFNEHFVVQQLSCTVFE